MAICGMKVIDLAEDDIKILKTSFLRQLIEEIKTKLENFHLEQFNSQTETWNCMQVLKTMILKAWTLIPRSLSQVRN